MSHHVKKRGGVCVLPTPWLNHQLNPSSAGAIYQLDHFSRSAGLPLCCMSGFPVELYNRLLLGAIPISLVSEWVRRQDFKISQALLLCSQGWEALLWLSWPLNNAGLDCLGPLIHGSFQLTLTVQTHVVQGQHVVGNPHVRRTDLRCTWIFNWVGCWRPNTPNHPALFKDQLYMIHCGLFICYSYCHLLFKVMRCSTLPFMKVFFKNKIEQHFFLILRIFLKLKFTRVTTVSKVT